MNKLMNDRLCDFLKTAHIGRPDNIQPLSKAISKIEDLLHVSRVTVWETGEFSGSIPIYDNHNIVNSNTPDWEYSEDIGSNHLVCVRFWNDGSVVWTEEDYSNMESLSQFIILYTNGMRYMSDFFLSNVQNVNDELVDITDLINEAKMDLIREKDIESKMANALDNGEFIVYYQPKIDLDTNSLIGAEALVRWVEDGKITAPGDFIPIIERNGFVCQLDFYILEAVLKDMRRWLDAGIEVVKTSVNFSRVHLSNQGFTNRIIRLLKEYNVPAEYIEIEFTESGYSDSAPMLENAIRSLKAYGIATAMDDFGSGYSSLSLLTNLSFDILKLDKSFLDSGRVSEKEKVIINNVIKMVQDLNIDVVMEGVETPEQVEFLRKANCRMVQGYVFDKPLPVETFEQRLANKKYPRELTA